MVTDVLERTSTKKDLPLEVYLFLLDRKLTNCSPQTLVTYERRLRVFLQFANKPPKDILKQDIQLYLLSLQNKNRSPHYIKGCHLNLKVFFKWMVKDHIIAVSPMQDMDMPKVPKRIKPCLPRDAFDRLLAACPNDFRGARNAAWLWLFWTTGCRIGGLHNLRLSDLDWKRSWIKVTEKGDRDRFVPFTPDTQKAVHRYLKARLVYMRGEDPYEELWISEERRPLTYYGIMMINRKLAQRAGLDFQDKHHIFRRSWLCRNLEAGVSLKTLQLVGGWRDLASLEIYARSMQSMTAVKSTQWH
jgi:integrase/recombinase XerD